MVIDTPISVDLHRTHYRLAKNAPAMQVLPDASGKLRPGTLIRLPEEAEVEICGAGFDDRTAKVLWEGSTYYIFLDDLQAYRPRTMSAWASYAAS